MPVAQPPQPLQPPRTDSWRFTPSEASDNERPATCPPQAQKNHLLAQVVFCVGENLFFRAVSSQVSSAPASLTSVFGMGTGGPSRQSTPTIQFAASLDSFNIIPQPFENCKPFFKIFRKNFAAKAAGLEKRLYKIVLKRASATRGFLKLTKSRAHLSYIPSQPPRTQGWRSTPGEASGNERSATCLWRSHRSHRGQTAGVSLRVKRVATSAPRLARGGLPAKKQPPYWATAFKCWRKPIFPDRLQSSIFGAGELNFRVRDGNGWTLAAINTNYASLPPLLTA